jgi:hypothetical protein
MYKNETSSGTLSTKLEGPGMTSGSGTVKFTGCKTAAGGCENTGAAGSKEITGTVSSLLVWVGKESGRNDWRFILDLTLHWVARQPEWVIIAHMLR